MRYVAVAVAVLVIFVLFAVGCLLAPLACLVLLPVNAKRASDVFQAMNRLCGAAYFGFDGRSTISKACGLRLRVNPNCEPCRRLCKLLNLADEGHCEKEAAR